MDLCPCCPCNVPSAPACAQFLHALLHAQVARRFTVLARGPALPRLRERARQRGQWLLQDLYPLSNSAALVIPDWAYNTEVCGRLAGAA